MELKNAVGICLISLCSATVVVLIARWLDLQAAARLEPQLIRIAEELEAIRKQGRIAPAASGPSAADASSSEAIEQEVKIYYFYGNARCPTCRAIESQAKQAVDANFGPSLNRGTLTWETLNYEQPAGEELAKKFDIQIPVVVVARMKDGQVEKWERLDRVWALVEDKAAFEKYLVDEVKRAATGADAPPPTLLDLPLPK